MFKDRVLKKARMLLVRSKSSIKAQAKKWVVRSAMIITKVAKHLNSTSSDLSVEPEIKDKASYDKDSIDWSSVEDDVDLGNIREKLKEDWGDSDDEMDGQCAACTQNGARLATCSIECEGPQPQRIGPPISVYLGLPSISDVIRLAP
jgi:hypothetical protein